MGRGNGTATDGARTVGLRVRGRRGHGSRRITPEHDPLGQATIVDVSGENPADFLYAAGHTHHSEALTASRERYPTPQPILVVEPGNELDDRAVAVYLGMRKVGFLPAKDESPASSELRDLLISCGPDAALRIGGDWDEVKYGDRVYDRLCLDVPHPVHARRLLKRAGLIDG